jgi:hypothetical protein
LSGVVIADAEALLGGLSLSGAVVFGTLPSDRLLEIADASATASETQPCCAEASCCVDPATVQPASPIARQILALRQSLAATSDCVLKFDSEAFVVYVGHGNAEVPSEASIILTTCANPAGEVDAALIDRPAVSRSTTLGDGLRFDGMRFDGMRFDGGAVVGPNVIGTQEAAALRFAADRLDEAAATILPVAGDEQPIAQPLRIAQPATDTLLR